MKSSVSAFYFIVLEVLWIFRMIYETIMPETSSLNAAATGNTQHQSDSESSEEEDENENENNAENVKKLKDEMSEEMSERRRHLIHLFTRPQENATKRPICYMQVSEIISPIEEEMIRCVCAKGFTKEKDVHLHHYQEKTHPPTRSISRERFTNVWMESFTLVV